MQIDVREMQRDIFSVQALGKGPGKPKLTTIASEYDADWIAVAAKGGCRAKGRGRGGKRSAGPFVLAFQAPPPELAAARRRM